MSAPTILAQITDPHIRLDDDGASSQSLSAAVDAVLSLATPADAVVVTGDLVDNPDGAAYARLQELLEPIAAPVHVLTGNHDNRASVRALFPIDAGPADGPYRYSVRVGDLALVGFDTTVPGQIEGAIDEEGIAWLGSCLEAESDTPTVIAMHHPPITTGNSAIDAISLKASEHARLADHLFRHPQVKRVICGHVHATVFDTLGGCPVVACAATHLQLPFEIRGGEELELVSEPGAIALHVLVDGSLKTHVRALRGSMAD